MFVASEDYDDVGLRLDQRLIQRPAATFFLNAAEDCPEVGIKRGDLLIVDRAQKTGPGSVIVAADDGELRPMRLPPSWKPEAGLDVWGAVLWIVRAP